MDIGLNTYTHGSELQAITVPPLISTIDKSPHHLLRLFQLAVSSPAVLVTASKSGDSSTCTLKSCLHSLPYRTDLVGPVLFLITPRHGPSR
jgi:hypothetical protein